MFQRAVLAVLFLFMGTQPALAAELTPGNLIGRYNVVAKVGLQKIRLNFRVVNEREFELQRLYANGGGDEVCNGTFSLNNYSMLWHGGVLVRNKNFKGVFTCPSNRSKRIDFNIDFRKATTADLIRGTTVSVTSSLAPGMRLSAYVKRR